MPKAKGKDVKQDSVQTTFSKFEAARILGSRSLQIADNAPIYTKEKGADDSFSLAKEELKEGKIPLKVIKRK